jgi:hypothetical protein
MDLHSSGLCRDLITENVLPHKFLDGSIQVDVHITPNHTQASQPSISTGSLSSAPATNAPSSAQVDHTAALDASEIDQNFDEDVATAAEPMETDEPNNNNLVIEPQQSDIDSDLNFMSENNVITTLRRSNRIKTTSAARPSKQAYVLRGASNLPGGDDNFQKSNAQFSTTRDSFASTPPNFNLGKRKSPVGKLKLVDDAALENVSGGSDESDTDDEEMKERDESDNDSADVADLEYIRVGHPVKGNVDNEIKLEAIMAAQIDMKKIDADKNQMCFVLVDSWTINGVQVGHHDACELYKPDLFDYNGTPNDWQPDAVFEDCDSEHAMAAKAIAMAREKRRSADTKATANRRKTLRTLGQVENPQALPSIPVISNQAFDGLQFPKVAGGVDIVIFFMNNTRVDIDLDLPVNLQANVPHGTNQDDFKNDYILTNDDKSFKGLDIALRKSLSNHWDVVIYVLPQVAGSADMYSWTERKDWTINQWLARDVMAQHGKQLYIEVHIVPKDGEEDELDLSDHAERAFQKQAAKENRKTENSARIAKTAKAAKASTTGASESTKKDARPSKRRKASD